jgi:ribonuclease J
MPDGPSLDFVPLGGAGEIGMNLNLYRSERRWLMVDAGVTFEREADDMRVLYPDPGFIVKRREQLEGIVLTHAHQDHIGAVADVWPALRCPVYATPFAAAMLEGPLAEAGLAGEVPVRPLEGQLRVGPFELERIALTHSIVEMGALRLRTEAGTVLHTGDFKIDADPVVGPVTDAAALRRVGREGVDVVVSDSTNADIPGWTGSEGSLSPSLRKILSEQTGRIAVPLFSTNIARIHTLAQVALELRRDLVLVGRSLERTVAAARRVGYLDALPTLVPQEAFGYLPPERVLMLCTGSQGEPRAGLSRIAADDHPTVYLDPGDTVVFSARMIPGNEEPHARILRQLRAKGVEVVTPDDAEVHVSGHPRQDELRCLYDWVRPRHVLPVHGTPEKLEAHAALAEALGLGAVRVRNGQMVRLGPDAPRHLGEVKVGRVERPPPKPPELGPRRREAPRGRGRRRRLSRR